MNANDILLLGAKSQVAALSKSDGHVLWSTALPGGLGVPFVTMHSDGLHVFAHAHGQLHCLDLATGRILWSNELSGWGYGIASLCLPGQAMAPDLGAVQSNFVAQQQAASSAH